MDASIARLARLIAGADAVLVVTGAGISTASGIPDYRGPRGVWRSQRPVEFSDFLDSEDHRIRYWDQKLATADVFTAARPTATHRACVTLEAAGRLEAVVTQNVDGLHTDAGSSAAKVVEVHGTAREASCLACGRREPIDGPLERFATTGVPPRCDDCGGLLKPATISFGQMLDPMTMVRAEQAADRCDLVVALGSTLGVYPAAAIPLQAASRGVPYVIVNRGATDHDHLASVTLRIEGDVDAVFPAAVDEALGTGRAGDVTGGH